MKKYAIISLFFCFALSRAQTYVLISDANFVAWLQLILPGAMNGNSLNITSPLVTTSTKTVTCWNNNISDLNGIQYFSSLERLECSGNSLTALPTLPNSLKWLDCAVNQIATLPALPNDLQYLNCCLNSLISLPQLPDSLKWLGCWQNSLTSLPSLPAKLEQLLCFRNKLTSLPSLPAGLGNLSCYNNLLTNLPDLPTSLQELNCSENLLTSLPGLPYLKILYCYSNNIDCFPSLPNSIWPPIPHPPYVQYNIELYNNPFTCLPNYLPSAMNPTLMAFPLCAAGNQNGCPVASSVSENVLGDNDLLVYPNPTSGLFFIERVKVDKQLVYIYELSGKLVYSKECGSKTEIDLSYLNEGIYIVLINIGDRVINKKVNIIK